MRAGTLVLALCAALQAGAAFGQDGESLRTAKALLLDKEYARARELLHAVRDAGGQDASTARYWIARCSESLGEGERALGEYAEFLAGRPADRTLAEEARTSRVAIAVKLAKAGRPQHLGLAREALSDPASNIRYFAALRLASLGPSQGQAAVPVLKEILAKETDEDLVERAKIALLRLDRNALAEASPPPRRAKHEASWIRVRIYEKGAAKPQLAINLPLALADLVFKSLPEDARSDLQKKGIDSGGFFERLKKTGPADILSIEGEDGDRIQVWIE